ncbi:MAG: pyridoxamine 5'-phosphate oxidase family protein [Allobaculum sp.]|nr:pyridoxamine 5'-phosphate oxidase family protein [Allobaculum sp.]
MNFEKAYQIFQEKLGAWKIMALASCVDNYPMVRNVSCLIYNEKIYFKTDKNFRKTKQLYENPRVALCFNGTQIEGEAHIKGLVVEEEGRTFETLYKKYLWQSYNAYSHEDTEILVEVTPKFVEIWDEDQNRHAYQIFLDFDTQEAFYKPYD